MTDTAPVKGIAAGTLITIGMCLLGYFAVQCGTGCKTTDIINLIPAITNAIPHSVTTTTQPAQTGGTVPSTPATPPAKPLPGADMTFRYNVTGMGQDWLGGQSTHWCSGTPGDVFEPNKGFEIPKKAWWSIVGTNYPAKFDGGWWYTDAVKASGLVNPVALYFEAASGTWRYEMRPGVPGNIKAVKQ